MAGAVLPARLGEMLRNSKNTVFFGGAGVSTESGIPDFRSADGLYNAKYPYPPETILSHSFFMEETESFSAFRGTKSPIPAQSQTRRISRWSLWKSGFCGRIKARASKTRQG